MKRIILVLLLICFIFTFSSCSNKSNKTFMATVIENTGSLLVQPDEGTDEMRSSDKIYLHTSDTDIRNTSNKKITITDISVNQRIEITYNGMIMESYPAQITASKIKLID